MLYIMSMLIFLILITLICWCLSSEWKDRRGRKKALKESREEAIRYACEDFAARELAR